MPPPNILAGLKDSACSSSKGVRLGDLSEGSNKVAYLFSLQSVLSHLQRESKSSVSLYTTLVKWMCSTHFITATMGIKSNLSKWPPTPSNYLLKTLEDKRHKWASSRTAESSAFPRERWSCRLHEPGILQASQDRGGDTAPTNQGAPGGPQKKEPLHKRTGWRGKASSFVSGQCCPPMAHSWSLLSPHLHGHPLVSDVSLAVPSGSHRKGKGGDKQWLIANSFCHKASENYSQVSGPASRAQNSACPGPCTGPTALPSLQVPFLPEVSCLWSSFPVNLFRGNVREKQEKQRSLTESANIL